MLQVSRENEGSANPAITDSFLPILFQSIGKLNPTILHRNSTELIIGINISLHHNLSPSYPFSNRENMQLKPTDIDFRFLIYALYRQLNTNELRKIDPCNNLARSFNRNFLNEIPRLERKKGGFLLDKSKRKRHLLRRGGEHASRKKHASK